MAVWLPKHEDTQIVKLTRAACITNGHTEAPQADSTSVPAAPPRSPRRDFTIR
jgi:hypothetical protein